jgi:hypothetical protein
LRILRREGGIEVLMGEMGFYMGGGGKSRVSSVVGSFGVMEWEYRQLGVIKLDVVV